MPANAQTQLPQGTTPTNVQQSGSQLLPSGVTPDVTVQATAYLSFRPNPVGVNQTFLVNVWLTPASHAARYFTDYEITIMKPNGDTEVIKVDSYRADTTAWFEYIADEVGTWKIKFDFKGGYFPAGNYSTEFGAVMYGQATTFSFPQSCYYTPSSTEWQELTVQEEPVNSWVGTPLPTDYWTRPISPENREWWWIAGHFPWRGPGGGAAWPEDTNIYWANGDRYRFTPWVQAPNTAHIVWRRQGAIGGLIGPIQGDTKVEDWTSGGGNPSIIYEGRCYQTVTEADVENNSPSSRTYWMCYDLRTGEVYWKRPLYTGESAPTNILYYQGYSEVPGGESRFSKDVHLVSISGGRLITYNPWNGAVNLNISIAPLTSGTYYKNGYWLTVQDLGANATSGRYRLINWTIEAIPGAFMVSSTTWRMSIANNITWPWSSLGTTWDLEAGIAVATNPITPAAVGAWSGTSVQAASLITGAQLWNKTYEETIYSSASTVADHGKVAIITMSGYWLGLNLNDGSVAWKSEALDYPWDSPGFGSYGVASAYGLFYRFAYSGVYAHYWDTGKEAWKYEAPANPYETPYVNPNGSSVYSFNAAGLIADGKLYAYNTEHTPTQPITRGWGLHCINATSGEGIWNITGCMTPGAIADGYLVASNSYDGYTYVFGKGQSATTVTAPLTAINLGQKIMLTGTIFDMSPGQPNTPCVSKESMTAWMEYLHMQHSISAEVIGVPISIDAVDPNGNFVHIGDVTSDGISGTFGFAWEPEIAGEYKVTATFMGDDSYRSSFATTYVNIVEAGATSPTPTSSAINMDSINNNLMMGLAAATIAIIIAIAIAVLLIRRK
ncbi:MAG: hypothetical protein ACQCN5_12820 [Candidatus Bathyarchaeia archaeon]